MALAQTVLCQQGEITVVRFAPLRRTTSDRVKQYPASFCSLYTKNVFVYFLIICSSVHAVFRQSLTSTLLYLCIGRGNTFVQGVGTSLPACDNASLVGAWYVYGGGLAFSFEYLSIWSMAGSAYVCSMRVMRCVQLFVHDRACWFVSKLPVNICTVSRSVFQLTTFNGNSLLK